jgi:hypothetical protein
MFYRREAPERAPCPLRTSGVGEAWPNGSDGGLSAAYRVPGHPYLGGNAVPSTRARRSISPGPSACVLTISLCGDLGDSSRTPRNSFGENSSCQSASTKQSTGVGGRVVECLEPLRQFPCALGARAREPQTDTVQRARIVGPLRVRDLGSQCH